MRILQVAEPGNCGASGNAWRLPRTRHVTLNNNIHLHDATRNRPHHHHHLEMYICCDKSFNSYDSLLPHLWSASHPTGVFCPTCCIWFNNGELLVHHLREAHQLSASQPLQTTLDQQWLYVDGGGEEPMQEAAPANTWFNTFRRGITSAVQYTQDTYAAIQRNRERLAAERAAADAERVRQVQARRAHAREEYARQAPAREALARAELARQNLARQAFDRQELARQERERETRARQARDREQLVRETRARYARARHDSDVRVDAARAQLAAIREASRTGWGNVHDDRTRQASRPTTRPGDGGASAGTWAELFDPPAAQTRPVQRPSALASLVPAPRPPTTRVAPNVLVPAQQSRRIPTRQIAPLAVAGPALVPLARQPMTLSSAAAAPRQVPSRIIPQGAVRQTPRTTATAPAPTQQATPIQPQPAPTTERPSAPPFHCDQCSRSFTFRAALEQHRSAVHLRNAIPAPVARAREIPDAPRFKCMSCHKTFINQYALDQHLVSNAHPENQVDGQPGYRCIECGEVFATRDALTLHAVGHVRERMRGG